MLVRGLALTALLLLSACALRPVEPPAALERATRDARLAALPGWEARGRIAVRAGDSGSQGSLHWLQQGEAAQLRVSGPFGAGAYEISWDRQALRIVSSRGEVTADYAGADAAEQFLEAQLGWSLPVGSSRYWMLGLADPGAAAEMLADGDGRPAIIRQHGWAVAYDDFTLQDGLWLPRRITVESVRARVRLVIDRWEF
jgi:outer membrane lipoprotein LolB